jgi:hypothetical protein
MKLFLIGLLMALPVLGQPARGFSGRHGGKSHGGPARPGGFHKTVGVPIPSGIRNLPAQITGQTFSRSVVTSPEAAINPDLRRISEMGGASAFPRGARPILSDPFFSGRPMPWNPDFQRHPWFKGAPGNKHFLGYAYGGYIYPFGWGGGTLVVVDYPEDQGWGNVPLAVYPYPLPQENEPTVAGAQPETIVLDFPPGARVRPATPKQ